MALSSCMMAVDHSRRELSCHGTAAYPLAIYVDDLRRENVPWHWHGEMEMGVVAEGSLIVEVSGCRQLLRVGDGFFVNSGLLHAIRNAQPGSDSVNHALVFHPRLVGGDPQSVIWEKYLQPLMADRSLRMLPLFADRPEDAALLDQLRSVWQMNCSEEPGFELESRNRLSALLYALQKRTPVPAVESSAWREELRIKQMLDCIHRNYAKPMTVKQIAASAAVSYSEAMRCFRHALGTTPMQYLCSYRIHQAAELLRQGGASVVDVGERCGFAAPSYFIKVFRRYHGCTPAQYRREAMEGALPSDPHTDRETGDDPC